MKYRPEGPKDGGPYDGVPSAEPGIYTMQIVRWGENIETKKGVRDVIDFTGDNDEGVTVGAALWISPPSGTKKGNLWMYRRLAEALGPDALAQYDSVDENGFSNFDPSFWKDRHVAVTVSEWGVDEVAAADPIVVRALRGPTTPAKPQSEVGDPQNLDDGRHDSGADDFGDVPF